MIQSSSDLQPLESSNSHGFAWIYRFDAQGIGQLQQPDNQFHLDHAGDGFVWAHINLADARAVEWLRHQPSLPAATIKMLETTETHPMLDQNGALIWGVVADLIRDFDKTSNKIGHLRFVLGERFLLSARRHPLQGAEAARLLIEAGHKVSAPAAMLEAIVERVVDAMALIVEGHFTELNEIEDRVLDDHPTDDRRKLGKIRRGSARLHRQLTGMRSIFHRFETQAQASFSGAIQAAATRLVQRIVSLHEEVHAIQDRARLLQEEISAKQTNETNANLALLTVVTTLFLPPTLITGIFGMNAKGMLFAENENGFIYAILMCVASAALVYWMMRRIGMVK